jgi:ketosteroid isomerase-like protein
MSNYEKLVIDYLQALSDMVTGDQLARFFHGDIEQREFPNQLVKTGATRNLAAMLEGAERGKTVLASQSYKTNNIISDGEKLLAEVTWTGMLNIPIGDLQAGDNMVAHFAVVFEFRDGLIWRQRNYDWFEPF